MRLIAYRKGSLSIREYERAIRGLPFTFLGTAQDFIWDYDDPTKSPTYQRDLEYKTLQQRKALSKC